MLNFKKAALAGMLLVAGCVAPPQTGGLPMPQPEGVPAAATPGMPKNPAGAARMFVQVIRRMEPAIERECLARRTTPINCDFAFVVDDRPGEPLNAFQTVDKRGRPLIGFTLALIGEARNPDELAFVVGHEASHHILNHLDRKARTATAGAVILGSIAAAGGGSAAVIQGAQNVGARFASRYYSKGWELQADYLGSIVAQRAGYDPINGARFFERIPDPGNHILGSHPSRADRQEQVRRAVGDLASGRAR